jgi:hypothetical protein
MRQKRNKNKPINAGPNRTSASSTVPKNDSQLYAAIRSAATQ